MLSSTGLDAWYWKVRVGDGHVSFWATLCHFLCSSCCWPLPIVPPWVFCSACKTTRSSLHRKNACVELSCPPRRMKVIYPYLLNFESRLGRPLVTTEASESNGLEAGPNY